MVKKFSVSLPDELAVRFEAFKGKLSPTSVFQAAMERQIDALERLRNRQEENLDEIVQRLRKEKAEADDLAFENGEEEGRAFARSASYSELKHAGEVLCNTCDLAERDLFKDEILGGYFSSLEDENGINPLKNLEGEAYSKWLQGWAWAVREFWDQVKCQI